MPRRVGHKRQGSIDFLESFGVVNEKITATASASPVQPRLTYDYVLVAKASDEQDKLRTAKQRDFIAALKAKKLKIHTVENAEKVFYCITAPTEIFETYKYLLKLSDVYNWSCEQQDAFPHSNRIRIVDFILQHTSTLSDEYLPDLVKKNVFETHFCLHEKREQKELKKRWARWSACFKGQPISNVRNYLGEKVAFYFLWLGWYTFLLIPAAVIGMVVFLYGLRFYSTSPLIKEVCQSNATMCPMCDNKCKVWKLADTCAYAKLSLLFDNEGTVAFAMFMAVWATVFLEFWKRHRSSYVCEWKVFDWCEEEEELILDIVNNPDCESKAHSYSYLRSTAVFVLGTLMLLVIIGLTYVLVVFRVIATVLLAEYSPWHLLSENSHTAALILGAVFHYVIITVMTRVNCKVSMKLSEIENKHSRTAIERSFTVKMFTFQFFTLFSTLIYTAFFLGRVNGHPGGYARIFGRWRLEECHPSGCLTDLFIQLSIIMILKQMFNNIFEYSGPWFSGWVKRTKSKKLKKQFDGSSTSKRAQETEEILICDDELLTNYNMKTTDRFSLFNEFLEMVIQFSFTTIFVAAFPLAPLLALLNNIVEIRLDAIKMVRLERRLVPAKANDIGVWTDVLEAIGVLAVIANGLVIGISSDFIPRLVYKYYYGPCASSNATDVDCMAGYISNTLSVANTSDQRVRLDFTEDQMVTYDGVRVSHCSYRDYRSSVDFSLTNQFWVNLAARLAFIILFEHIVVACKSIAGWFVPNSPLDVKNGRMCGQLKRLKEELRAQKAQNKSSALNEQNGLSGKKEELQMKQNTL